MGLRPLPPVHAMLILFFFTEGVPVSTILSGNSFDKLVGVNGLSPVDFLVLLEPLVVFDGERFLLGIVLTLQDINHPLPVLLVACVIAADMQTTNTIVASQEEVGWSKLRLLDSLQVWEVSPKLSGEVIVKG